MANGLTFRQRFDRVGRVINKAMNSPVSVAQRAKGTSADASGGFYARALNAGVKEKIRGETTAPGLRRYPYRLLRTVSEMDLLTTRLIDIYAFTAAQANWDCVPDIDIELDELRRWQNQEVVNLFQDWNDTEIAPFESPSLKADLTKSVRNNVNAIRAAKGNGADQLAVIRMLEQTFDAAEAICTQEAKQHASKVREMFTHPNEENEPSFDQMVEPWSRDLCTYGVGYIAIDRTKNAQVAGKKIARLRYIPADQMTHYVTEPEGNLPQSPAPAFIRRIDSQDYEQFLRRDIALGYYRKDPDTYGTGPVETALTKITFSAKLDNLADSEIARFYLGEAILNVGPDRNQESAQALSHALREIMSRSGMSGEIPIVAGVPWETQAIRTGAPHRLDPTVITLDDRVAAQKCAAFGLSPQDAGQVWDFHRTSAEVQKELTEVRGIRTFLQRLAKVLNDQVIKPNFPFQDVKFAWTDLEAENILEDHAAWCNFLDHGVITRADIAKMLGKPIYPGQTIPTFNNQFVTPVAEIQTTSYTQRTAGGQQGQEGQAPGMEGGGGEPMGGAPEQQGGERPPSFVASDSAIPVPNEFNPWAQQKIAADLNLLKRRIGKRADELLLKAARGDVEGINRIARELKSRTEKDIQGLVANGANAEESLVSVLDRLMTATDAAARAALESRSDGEA